MNADEWKVIQRPDGLWFLEYDDHENQRYESLLITPTALLALKETLLTWSRTEIESQARLH